MLAIEIEKTAERLFPYRADLDGRAHTVHFGIVEAPFRLAVTARGALEQFAAGSDLLSQFGLAERIERVLEHHFGGIGHRASRAQRCVGHLIHPVHRRGQSRARLRRQRRRPAKFTNRHQSSHPLCVLQRTIVEIDLECVNAPVPQARREQGKIDPFGVGHWSNLALLRPSW